MEQARVGLHGFEEEVVRQRRIAGRSAPYERALALLPDVLDGRAGRLVEAAWRKRRFFAWFDRPLLMLAALRNDALAEGASHPLWAGFGPDARAEAVTRQALEAALAGPRDRVWDALANRAVQTNETSRAVAWLWPALLAGASHGGRRIALADIGASAGLNLVADRLPNVWTGEDGAPLEIARDLRAVSRLGLDADPLDATDEDDARWLRACVWPGERDRLARLDAAIEAFRASRTWPDAPVLLPILARDVPARIAVLSAAEPDVLVIAFQTVMSAYLSPGDRAEYERGMRNWLQTHAPASTLWIELEEAPDGAIGDAMPAWILAHVRGLSGDVETYELARCGYHPTRIARNLGEVEALRCTLSPQALSEGSARI